MGNVLLAMDGDGGLGFILHLFWYHPNCGIVSLSVPHLYLFGVSGSSFKVCVSYTKRTHLHLDTEKSGVERPGRLGPPLDVFGNQGLTDLPIYCHNWLRKNQKCPWGSSEFFLKLHTKLAKVSLGPSQLDFLLLYFAYSFSPSLTNTLLTNSSGGICFWST